MKGVAPAFKLIDRRRARFPAAIAANSEFVRERIRSSWDRDATVIYPPVDVSRIASVSNWVDALSAEEYEILAKMPDEFLLGASRLVPYKRLDAVIRAGEEVDLPVVVVGSGTRFRALASTCCQRDSARDVSWQGLGRYVVCAISTRTVRSFFQPWKISGSCLLKPWLRALQSSPRR